MNFVTFVKWIIGRNIIGVLNFASFIFARTLFSLFLICCFFRLFWPCDRYECLLYGWHDDVHCILMRFGSVHFSFVYLKKTCVSVWYFLATGEIAPVNGEEGLTAQSAKTEISLTLTNKFEVPDDDDSDMRALFVRWAAHFRTNLVTAVRCVGITSAGHWSVYFAIQILNVRVLYRRTKRMIVDVLKVQPGENLTEILETTATDEQVSLFFMCHFISRCCQVSTHLSECVPFVNSLTRHSVIACMVFRLW